MTLTEFLTARIEEGRASAVATLEANARSRGGGLSSTLWDEEDAQASRMLREVEAKRKILARYEDCLARMEDPDYPAGVAQDQAREYEDFVLPNLTAVWSDHPDYDETWR